MTIGRRNDIIKKKIRAFLTETFMKFTNYYIFKDDLDAHGIEYAAEHTCKLGFDSVEFLDFYSDDEPILPDRVDIDETRRTLDKYGLDVSCYSVGINILELGREKSVDILMKHAKAAAKLGSPFLHHTLVFPLTLPENAPSYEEILDTVVDSAKVVADGCAKLGITCIYEPQGMYFNGIDGLGGFFERIKALCPGVGICGDFGNSLFVDVDPKGVISTFAPNIKHVHIKDYTLSESPMEGIDGYVSRGGTYIYETGLGTGAVDFSYGFNEIKKFDYDGAISFEFYADDAEMCRSIEYVKGLLK